MKTWFRAGRRPAAAGDSPEAAGLGVPEVAATADVVLVTRQGCHLCDEAAPVVGRVARLHGATVKVVDVDEDEALREQFTAHVPVVFVHGRLLSYWTVDAERLEQAIAAGWRPSEGAG